MFHVKNATTKKNDAVGSSFNDFFLLLLVCELSISILFISCYKYTLIILILSKKAAKDRQKENENRISFKRQFYSQHEVES